MCIRDRAYEVLSDPDKRRNYDMGVDPFATGGGNGFSGQGFSFSDVMDAFFGGAATQRGPRTRAHRGQDALVRIQIDLHDAVFGSEEEPVSYTHLDVYKRQVYEFLDGCEQSWLQIGIRVDRGEDATPGQREICRRGVRPPQRGADAFLPRLAARDDRPLGPAESGRLDRLPHVDIGVPEDQRMTLADGGLGADSVDDGRLLGRRHEMVDEDTQATARPWGEGTDGRREVIDAVKLFDDDPFDPVSYTHLDVYKRQEENQHKIS